MKIEKPFHDGEVIIQEMLSERSTAILNGRLYDDSIIGPAHKFLSQLHFFILSTEHESGELPVSIVFGPPGFISVDDSGKYLKLELQDQINFTQDPVLSSLKEGARTGGLAIDLETRRRLRINGHVNSISDGELRIEVDESYPNCPKYIQKRQIIFNSAVITEKKYECSSGQELLPEHFESIRKADTFFVSSSNPQGNLDASHRGGNPGFVQIRADGSLRIPDYPGNSLYNTFGNFQVNDSAGLVFWDVENACLLHLFGCVAFEFSQDPSPETGGTGRWWIFHPKRWFKQIYKSPIRFSSPESSPFNP